MKMTRILLLLGLLFAGRSAMAQVDSVFWFAAPWVSVGHANNVPVVLRFSTFANPTTVRIQQPAGTYDTTFTVAPNSLFSKDLSHIVNSLEAKPANTTLNYGLKITSDEVMTVVYEQVTAVNNPETFSLKGKNGMGQEFVCPFQNRWNNGTYPPQPKSQINIVATEDNTTIFITPKAAVIGHGPNVTYSIVLNKGQVYTVENVTHLTTTPGNNLGGTIIVSDKPISVTVYDDSVAVPSPSNGANCRDGMGDQLVPTDVIGSSYIVNRGGMFTDSHEGFFAVATENFTNVAVNDGSTSSVLLNRGDTYYYEVTQPLTSVNSDKPVYVMQASGFGCEIGAAILPPINCAGSSQVSFTRTNNQTFILNILCQTSATGSFLLNGSPTLVPASAFAPVPGTAGLWSGAQITFNTTDIPAGTANLLENTADVFALGVINGGSTSGCLYHYLSSFIRKVVVTVPNDTTLCNGDPSVLLNGTVSNGSTTGIWTVLDGTGTLNNPTNLSTTYVPSPSDYFQGSLTFVLTSTGNCNPVSDTFRVTFINSPVVNAGTDQIFCKNNIDEVPLSGTVSFAAAGVWSGGNGGSFDNSGSLNTTYSPSPADLAADSVIIELTSQGSFFACPSDVDTIIIRFTEPPVVSAGPDQNLCSNASTAPLSGSVSGPTTTGIWSTNGGGSFSPNQTNLSGTYNIAPSDTSAGIVRIYLTSTNNGSCLAVQDSLDVILYAKPEVEITTADSICSNTPSVNLTGDVSSGFSVTWTTTGTGSILDPNDADTYYNVSAIDTTNAYITFVLSTTSAICPSVSDTARLYFVAPPAVDAGPDQLTCDNVPVALSGTVTQPGQIGTWSTLGTGTFNPSPAFLNTLYQPSAGDTAAGSVRIVLYSDGSFGCAPETDTMVITFQSSPVADFIAVNACQNVNASFTDASTLEGGTISGWYYDFGDGTNSIAQNPLHNYPADGNFNTTLIVQGNNGCYDTVVKPITIYPVAIPDFTFSLACENNPVQFNDNSFVASGSIVSWLYDFGGGFVSTAENPTNVFEESGTYPVTMTVTTGLGCVSSTTENVTIIESPTAAFTINPNPALVLSPVNFTDQSYGDLPLIDWYWSFGDGQADNNQNTTHIYQDGGDYFVTLTVTDSLGCKGSATQKISLSLLPVLPTGFTPNGDGENDVFIIRGGPFSSVDFKIYNNWGQLIFSTTELDKGWDGTYEGSNAPIGVYTWTFVVGTADGTTFRDSGDVTLMR